jgi:hypothetical protein
MNPQSQFLGTFQPVLFWDCALTRFDYFHPRIHLSNKKPLPVYYKVYYILFVDL